MSRNEQLLEAIINGEKLEDFKPLSRTEQILLNCVNKKGLERLPAPLSRSEALLQGLANMIKNGLGGSGNGSGGEVTNNVSLNVSYGTTPPSDITKVWIATNEPESVEIQTEDITIDDYLIGEVKNLGTIENTFAGNGCYFDSSYYKFCYMEDYKIITLHYRKIIVYDLKLQEFVFNYDCSYDIYDNYHGISAIEYKNNIVYFVDAYSLYSFNFNSNEFVKIVDFSSDTNCLEVLDSIKYSIGYMFFNDDNTIDFLGTSSSNNNCHFRYNLKTRVCEKIADLDNIYGTFSALSDYQSTIKVNNYIYSFCYNSSYLPGMKYNISNNTIEEFTSFKDFLGSSEFYGTSVFYDNEKFIYLIGGGYNTARQNIIIYNTLTDSFETTENQLLGRKSQCLSFFINNRAYIFGGNDSNSHGGYGTRINKLDYFDIYYPLNNNNSIFTINIGGKENSYNLIDGDKIKLFVNIKDVYFGNSENQAKQINIYKYKIISNTSDSYSSITFDKNSIVNNFDSIVNAISSTSSGMLSVTFGGDSSSFKYASMICVEEDIIMASIVNESYEFATMFGITRDGTLEESYMGMPCTWTTGDSTTVTFDSNLEVNALNNVFGGDLVTPQVLIDLGICTFEFIKGEIIGKWAGINCEDYNDSATGGE